MVDIDSTLQDNFDVEKLIEQDVDVAIVENYQYNGAPKSIGKLDLYIEKHEGIAEHTEKIENKKHSTNIIQ